MKEKMFENYEVQKEEKEEEEDQLQEDENVNELIKQHNEIEKKPVYTKEEIALKHEVKFRLLERGMKPSEIADCLGLDRSTISYWIAKHYPEKLKKKTVKHSYETTKKGRMLVNKLVNNLSAEAEGLEKKSVRDKMKGTRAQCKEF